MQAPSWVFVFSVALLGSVVLPDTARAYRPVVIVHGILDSALALFHLRNAILEAHPGTEVYMVAMFQDMKSAWPMWTQVLGFGNAIKNISDIHKDQGINIIGYSQGGLISRGVIQSVDDLNVHTFISLSSPQGGQYGDTSYLFLFPHYLKDSLYKILYSKFGQTFSVGGYWRDPHHLDLYRSTSQYLALINQETRLPNPNATSYKTNLTKLKKLVLIGGPEDGVITPWQSAHFGNFDENETVVPLTEQDSYKNDDSGLRTLNERGDLVLLEMAGITHVKWHVDPTVFRYLIQPYLS
ncbi:Lysosomal thioesterase PPT2-A [Hypsibius exemplaris]|uniref:palmitoyl-CoA hydrolase n=1 Tax=Hypsibius exemplaris TaxID=2072580 RepID=A0A1W0WKT9_HYPEX|nr:Lysosomal thioesterase PPT2-A [Hypsibius exemplaris]